MTTDPRAHSRALVDGADRAAARAYFKAVGFTDADLAKPLVGVAHCWIEITPCNWNHRALALKVKEGIRAAGGTPIEFNTITVTTRVDGQLQRINFVEGQEVKTGDLLAQIDPRPYQAVFDQAVATEAKDQAQLANAKLDLQRFATLGMQVEITEADVDGDLGPHALHRAVDALSEVGRCARVHPAVRLVDLDEIGAAVASAIRWSTAGRRKPGGLSFVNYRQIFFPLAGNPRAVIPDI